MDGWIEWVDGLSGWKDTRLGGWIWMDVGGRTQGLGGGMDIRMKEWKGMDIRMKQWKRWMDGYNACALFTMGGG